MPFVHNLVYGLGKPLLERRAPPRVWATSAERRMSNTGAALNPVAFGIRMIRLFDRRNNLSETADIPAENIRVSARAAK
jgi:2-polyprenyl-6-hydroxyphenyl methylase / 3-demethylubiquinone-9 3-methyltransferase